MIQHDRTLEETIRALPADLRREVADFVEFLLAKRHWAELEQLAVAAGWPVGFIAQTAGAIADPTFVRQPQGDADERVPFP